MLSISHALTGAFIAHKIPNVLISTPLILASHYIEDWILHWDVGTGLSNGTRRKVTAIVLEIFDLVITLGLVYWWFQVPREGLYWTAWFGAFVGLLPDFLEAPRNFFHFNPPWLKPFNDFHHNFHHSTPNMLLGLVPQAIVLILIFFLR